MLFLLEYSDSTGQAFPMEEMAQFPTYYCPALIQLDVENVVVLCGCCSVFSALPMVLCDPGETFLPPPPFYAGFPYISHLYAKVELIHVHQDSEITEVNTHLFQLTVGQLVKTLLEAKLKGEKSKGLVLINPQNPLGGIYSWDSLKEYLEFAKRYALHEIIGEIYCV